MKFKATLYDENNSIIEPEICPHCKGKQSIYLIDSKGRNFQFCPSCTIQNPNPMDKDYFSIWKAYIKNKVIESVVLDLTKKIPQKNWQKRKCKKKK